jgi:hypothetical protein
MGSIKMLGLVTVLAFTGLALAGVAPAAAENTKLCKQNEALCSAENTWPLTFATLNGATLKTPEGAKLVMPEFTTVNCPTGKLASTLEETKGPLLGEVWRWNTFNCTPSGCTLMPPIEQETGYSAEVTATGGGNGILTVGLAPTVIASCTTFPKATCTYTATKMEFTVKGGPGGEGKNPQLSSEAPMKRVAEKSSLACPPTATYVSLYAIVEPGPPMFVTH